MKRTDMSEPRWMLRVVALSAALVLCSCRAALKEEQPWPFVAAIGGLEIAVPTQTDDIWRLPVRADVSGLQTITHKPTTLNSGLVCDSTKARIKGRDIFIVIVTTVPHDNLTSVCPPALLGDLAPGEYAVLYGSNRSDGVRLGRINVVL